VSVVEQAHQAAMRMEFSAVAGFLQETLGQRLTAYAAGVRDPKTSGKYLQGRPPRNDETERRLRALYQVVQLLLDHDTPRTVRAWMIGANPELGDEAPIERLHLGDVPAVLNAARAFVVGG
jgi:hypothetical protein